MHDTRGRSRKGLQEAVNLRDADGHTALELAFRQGNFAAVDLLLRAGANPLPKVALPEILKLRATPLRTAAINAARPGGLETLELVISAAEKHALNFGEIGAGIFADNLHFALKGAGSSSPSQIDADGVTERMKAAAFAILRKLDEISAVSEETVAIAAGGCHPDVLQAALECKEGLLVVGDGEVGGAITAAAGSLRVDNVRLLLTRYRELIAAGASDAYGQPYTADAYDWELAFAVKGMFRSKAREDPSTSDIEAGHALMEIFLSELTDISLLCDEMAGAMEVLRSAARKNPPALLLLLDRLAGHPQLAESLDDYSDGYGHGALQIAAHAFMPESVRFLLRAMRGCKFPGGSIGQQASFALEAMCERMENERSDEAPPAADALPRRLECASLLLEAGADAFVSHGVVYPTEDEDDDSGIPFWRAIQADALEVVELFVVKSAAGVEITLSQVLKRAVAKAAHHGSARCLRYLFAASRHSSPGGRTRALFAAALDAAVKSGIPDELEGPCAASGVRWPLPVRSLRL